MFGYYGGPTGAMLRLEGLEEQNQNAYERVIGVQGADYVINQPVIQGRSWGSFVVPNSHINGIVEALGDHGLVYVGYSP